MKQQILSVNQNQNNHHHPKTIDKAFYTDLNEKSQIEEQEGRLRKYVDQIEQKIGYAKWKQQLVLKYNYVPIKRITDRIINEKINYIRKISEEEKRAAKVLSGNEITVQLDLFRQFSKQLNQKMENIKSKIAEEKIKNGLLEKEVQDKRNRLKQKMRENMQTIKSTLEDSGIKSKDDLIILFRSKSTKDGFKPISLTARTQVSRKISERKVQSQVFHHQRKNSNRNFLFEDCWNELVLAIRQEKRSSQTDRYRKIQSSMRWEKFKILSYKEIVNMLVDKFKSSQKIKRLLLSK